MFGVQVWMSIQLILVVAGLVNSGGCIGFSEPSESTPDDSVNVAPPVKACDEPLSLTNLRVTDDAGVNEVIEICATIVNDCWAPVVDANVEFEVREAVHDGDTVSNEAQLVTVLGTACRNLAYASHACNEEDVCFSQVFSIHDLPSRIVELRLGTSTAGQYVPLSTSFKRDETLETCPDGTSPIVIDFDGDEVPPLRRGSTLEDQLDMHFRFGRASTNAGGSGLPVLRNILFDVQRPAPDNTSSAPRYAELPDDSEDFRRLRIFFPQRYVTAVGMTVGTRSTQTGNDDSPFVELRGFRNDRTGAREIAKHIFVGGFGAYVDDPSVPDAQKEDVLIVNRPIRVVEHGGMDAVVIRMRAGMPATGGREVTGPWYFDDLTFCLGDNRGDSPEPVDPTLPLIDSANTFSGADRK